ncbi:Translation initiation factor 3 subunit J component [Tulasnella sp. 330]|nr:Translation initiation factor 3 subunit J component [Tulasnella sp. 330]
MDAEDSGSGSGSEEESGSASATKPSVPAAPKVVPKKKWADEDEEEEVAVSFVSRSVLLPTPTNILPSQSDWEASEEEDDEKAKGPAKPTVLAPTKKKGSLKQKLAEKAAANEARLAEGEDSPDTEDDLIDPLVKKRLDRERELQADMKNAEDLLGGNTKEAASSSAGLNALLTANPNTKEEFVDLSKRVIETIFKRLENKPLYATFLEHHVRELARPLRDVDIRKTASGLTALANEKQKEAKESGKKKKTAKPALGTVKVGKADTRVYDEALDDFGQDPDDFGQDPDDFM